MMTLKPSWIQISLVLKTWCSFSYCTLQRMGYIMTSRPIALASTLAAAPSCLALKSGEQTYGNRDVYEGTLLQGWADIVDEVA